MTTPNWQQKSFFATLFDFTFASFITLRFLKVIYGILMALILLTGVIFFFSSLASGSALGVVFGLIVVPLATLVYLILTRVGLEVLAMFFRIGDNTALTVQLLTGGSQPPHAGYGPPAGNSQPWGGTPDPAAQFNQPTVGYPYAAPAGPYGGPVPPPPAPPQDASGQSGWGPSTPSR